MPGLNDLSDSEDESEDSSEEYSGEDDNLLHGEAPNNADSDPRTCLIGKYIAKEFLLAKGREKRLYTAEITA